MIEALNRIVGIETCARSSGTLSVLTRLERSLYPLVLYLMQQSHMVECEVIG